MNKNRLRSTVVTLIVAMVLIGMTFGAMADPCNVPKPIPTVSTVEDVFVYKWLGLIGIQYPVVNTDSSDSSINENVAVQNTGFNESEDSKPLPHGLSQTQIGILSYSYESDRLKITVGEQSSSGWDYQYDPVGDPDNFIRSVYGEHYAVATDTWGSVKRSDYDFTVDTYFDSAEAPDTATLHYGNLSLTRQVTPPVGSARSFSIAFVLTNTGDSTLENVRFFQGVDYDIYDAGNDYAWYSETSDTVWQNDDNYFKNGFHGSRTSSHHDCNYYGSMWDDMHSGTLNDLTKYPESDTDDCGIALQWDVGDLAPHDSWDLTITFYFGEAAGIEANAGPDQNAGRSQPVTFDASGSSSVSNITTYEWDFDNDSIYDVSVSTPVYVYEGWTELGEYTVGLQITDDEGRNDTDTVKLTVVPNVDLLVLDITFTPTEINDGNIVIFNATMENIGTEDLTDDFYVRFEVDGSYIGRQQVSGGLPAGGSVRVLQNWEADAGTHNVKAVVDYYNRINESNENNNELSQALPEIPFPDLTVTNLIWSPATDIAHGDTVTFTATVENIGANTSSSIYVRFEIDNCYIGHRAISGLTAGKSTEASLSWHADAGIHNVQAVVDYYDEISESIETNNELVKSLPEILSPDLTVTDIEWIPTAIKDGDTITFNATVNNNEGSTSRDFYVRFEVDGEYIGRKLISGLSAGANTIVTQNWIAYAGSHNVTVYVDEYDAITESDETNNKMSEDLPFIPYPDLTVTNISWMPTNIVGGDAVTFTATVKNVGAGNTPRDFYVRFEVDSKYIGRAKVSDGLDSGNTIDVTQTWTATWANTVNVSVDEYDAVAESNESNNTMSKALLGLPFPDLNVTNLTWDPKENVGAGDPITFTATIENMGGTFYSTMSNPLKIAFLVNDEYVGCRNIVGGIRVGQPLTTTFTWTAQPGTNPTVCVKVDYSDIIPESNEDNNELCETLTLAIKSPDLAIIQLTFEPTGSVHVGDTVKFTAKVANIGEGNYSGDFDVGFYVDDTFAGVSQVFSGIPAGENTFSTFNWTASSCSNPVIKAKADFFDVVRESDEDNNERTEVLPASIPYADLEITDINWTPCENIEDRDPVVFNVTVKNNGHENVVTDFNVYFDIDGYFTRTNLISGGLAADESKTISFTWKATPGDGHTATAKADPDNVVPESDKTNNERIQPLPFDVSLVEIFEVMVEPAETTTGIGGQTSCKIKINNHGSASSNLDISVAGLDQSWYILSETSIFLSAGEEGIVDLDISVPDACENSGTFPFPVSVTSQETGITKEGSATLIVEPTPVIYNLLPQDRASLGSDGITFSWNTYINATTTLYLKAEDEVDYTSYTGAAGQIHTAVVSNLARNKNYSYYAESTSSCGSSTRPVRTFYIGNGVSFTKDVYEFTVERDYDQQVTIRVQNTDNEYHELLVEVPITYEELVLGFVGDGSQDNVIPLNPGESKDVTLAIQCADTMEEDYELIANLTSTKGDEILTDTARIKLHVHVPCIDYDLEEIGVDPVTLTKTFKMTNKGDPIADLTISVADSLKENVYIEPVIDHFRLNEGATIEFNVVPLLSSPDFQAASEVASALSGVEAASSPAGVTGDIVINRGRFTVTKTLSFSVPVNKGVYEVKIPNVIFRKHIETWFCNNRPQVRIWWEMITGIKKDTIILDPLIIKFNSGGNVRPHDVYISINGHEVGSLINTIPNGYYKFNVDPSFLIYPERGVSRNCIEIHTVHQNGGHYVVGSDMEVHLDLRDYTTHLVASSQEEANQIALDNLPPGLYKAPDSIILEEGTVSQLEESTLLTSSTTEVLLGKPTTLQATSSPNLMVWAEFDNGDAQVYLAEVGSGMYKGIWTPANYPEATNGNCVITIRAKGPGGEDEMLQGEIQRTVKIINPTKLMVEICNPLEGFMVSVSDAIVVSVRITRTDDQGRDYGSPDSSQTSVTAHFTNGDDSISLSATDGVYTGTWTPKNPGDCTVEVKAVDNRGELRSGSDRVSGTVGGLSRVEVVQIPKHVVKDVSARFIVYAYDSSDQIIPTTDLTYEWYIDSADNQVATSTQILDYTFDTIGSHKVYCKVTYGAEHKLGRLDVNVEPFTIEFKPPTKFSPMSGESAVMEFKVNTPAKVCFDDVVIPQAYYPTWVFDDKVDIDIEVMALNPDQWYKVTIWDGRIDNGRPAINGPYTVELRAKPLPWWFFEDKTCKVRVYDDPGKFVSIERDHIIKYPHPAHKSGEVKGYVKWLGGEEGGYVVKTVKIGASTVVAYLTGGLSFLNSCIVGTIAGQCLDGGDDWCVEYVALYEYGLEKVHWYPYVTDGGTKYGPIQNWMPILMREDVTRTLKFSGTQVTKQEKSESYGVPLFMRGLLQYIDQSTIKEVPVPEYTYSINKEGKITYYPGIWHDISKAELYDKDTPQGKKYREKILNAYKRLTNVPVANGMQHSEIMKAASLCYGSETIYDPLSAPLESYASTQSQPAEFSGAFSDYGTDANGDGLYDTLTVLPGVDVSVAGNYIVEAGLFDDSGAPIVWSGNYSQLEPGTHDIVLHFNGIMVYRHGVAGHYNLKYIRLYDENLTQIDNMTDAYLTSAYDYADFQVPPANFSEFFSDQGTDTDSGELFNYLTVSVGVDVLYAGNYTIIGNLVDSSGEPVTWANLTNSLDSGSHTLNLDFDGADIRQHGVSGPCNLSVILISDGTLVHSLVDTYTTSSYSPDDFQPASAQFNGVFSDYGRGTDGDGRYDYLTLSAGVDVFQAGSYTVTGYLYDENEGMITWANNTTFWNTGSQPLYLDFDGVGIRQHAVNGPYNISVVLVKEETLEEELSYASHTTSAYNYGDFQAPPDDFSGNFSDYGKDTDDDGFFNYLALSAEVAVSNAGGYGIVGNLYDKNGELITWTTNYNNLDVGSQSMVLHFDGLAISEHAIDGPYEVSLALLRDGNPEEVLSSSSYTTSAYSYTDFQAALAELSGFFSDSGTDTDSNGFYDYLTVEVGINVIDSGNYSIEARLDDANGSDIVHAYCSTALDTGTQTLQLNFEGCSIREHGLDGPYNLSYVRLYNQNGIQIDCRYDAHTTSAYNYTQFEGYPVDLSILSSDIAFDPETPTEGETVIITATIRNTGTDDVGSVVVQFFDGDPRTGGIQICDNQTITSIPAGGDETVSVDWTSEACTHTIYVRVDPFDSIQESNEENNIAFNIILLGVKGDLNNDGTLTPADAVIALQIAAGSHSFDPATLAAADVSGDNRVTSLDALMILQAARGAITL